MANQAVKLSPAQVARRHLVAREEARATRKNRIQAIAVAIACAAGMFALWTSASERETEAFEAAAAAEAAVKPQMGLRELALNLATRSGDAIECIEAGKGSCN